MIHAGVKLLLKTKKLEENAKLPTKAHPNDAGLDLYALETTKLDNNQVYVLRTGIAIELPYGTVGLILDRSSMGIKGFKVFGGVIDSDYRGELFVGLGLIIRKSITVHAGDRIAQLVIVPIVLPEVYEVDMLDETQRAHRGLGSSGV